MEKSYTMATREHTVRSRRFSDRFIQRPTRHVRAVQLGSTEKESTYDKRQNFSAG